MVIYFNFLTSGPPAPYQPQGWGNGYPHWQQGQPDPSEYLLLVGLKLKKSSSWLSSLFDTNISLLFCQFEVSNSDPPYII